MQKRFIQKYLLNSSIYTSSLLLLLLSVIAGVSFGSVHIPFIESVHILIGKLNVYASYRENVHTTIVTNIRLPRVILAGLVGGSLAISGAAFQGLLRNPLADAYTLGVSSGASVGAVMTIFFQISIPMLGLFTLPIISIFFAFITIVLVVLFAKFVDSLMRVETIVLTGVIFSAFTGGVISLIIALTGSELREIMNWLLGSVAMRGWNYSLLLLPFFLISSITLFFCTKQLDILSFGEEHAQHLGVSVKRVHYIVLITASLLTGATVAVSGTIGFVGLIVPHVVRGMIGASHRHVLPLSIIFGATFLIVCDLISRTLIQPLELPIGVITSLIGAPVFAMILWNSRKRKRG